MTGKIKKKYKKHHLRHVLLDELMKVPHTKMNDTVSFAANFIKCRLLFLFIRYRRHRNKSALLIQRIFRGFRTRMTLFRTCYYIKNGANIHEDIITCMPFTHPVIIVDDWETYNFTIYDIDTLLRCPEVEYIPQYTYMDYNEEIVHYITYYKQSKNGKILYKSPMTRRLFTNDGIGLIQHKFWYQLALKINIAMVK